MRACSWGFTYRGRWADVKASSTQADQRIQKGREMQIQPKKETILEDGWYPFTIGETEEKDTKFGERFMIPFELEADDGVVEVTAFISYSDHPKSNMVKWGKALFGDRAFDTDEFQGQTGEAFVEEGEDSEGQPKNFIRKVRQSKKGAAKNGKGKKEEVTLDESDFDDIPL